MVITPNNNDVWSKYNIIIDAKNSLLWLHRFEPDTPPHPIYDFGFRNRTGICRGWIVSSLTRDGDAVNAGMELGDTIIAVNGRNVADYSWDEEYDIDKLPKLHLDIVGADGKEKHIALESKERWQLSFFDEAIICHGIADGMTFFPFLMKMPLTGGRFRARPCKS